LVENLPRAQQRRVRSRDHEKAIKTRAFGVYRGDKMSHAAVTLLRAAPGQPWLRLDSFVTPAELLKHYRRLVKESGQAVAALTGALPSSPRAF
jgi:hypothetical protein